MNTDPAKKTGHYIHQITYNYRERVVGLFVFSAFVLFSGLIIFSGKSQHLFENRVTFYIDVNSSEGISHGSVVKTLGTEVGKVSDLNLTENRKIRVTIEVYEGRRALIREGAKAIVNRLVSINDALIEIESDSMNAPELHDGAIIPVEETPSLNDLLLGIASIIQAADNNHLLTKFENILPQLELTIENAHKIIAQIATGHGTLGAAVFDQKVEKNLKTVVKSGAEILTEAEGIVDVAKKRLIELEPVLNDVKSVTGDLRGVTHNLPGMAADLKEIIVQVKTAVALINAELIHMPGVSIEARRSLTKANRLLDSIQNTWPFSQDIHQPASTPLIPAHPVND